MEIINELINDKDTLFGYLFFLLIGYCILILLIAKIFKYEFMTLFDLTTKFVGVLSLLFGLVITHNYISRDEHEEKISEADSEISQKNTQLQELKKKEEVLNNILEGYKLDIAIVSSRYEKIIEEYEKSKKDLRDFYIKTIVYKIRLLHRELLGSYFMNFLNAAMENHSSYFYDQLPHVYTDFDLLYSVIYENSLKNKLDKKIFDEFMLISPMFPSIVLHYEGKTMKQIIYEKRNFMLQGKEYAKIVEYFKEKWLLMENNFTDIERFWNELGVALKLSSISLEELQKYNNEILIKKNYIPINSKGDKTKIYEYNIKNNFKEFMYFKQLKENY